MSRYAFDTVKHSDNRGPSPDPAETLEILAAAMGRRVPSALDRIVAASDRIAPDEGLALLSAYLAIENRKVRQAVLDAVVAVSGGTSLFG